MLGAWRSHCLWILRAITIRRCKTSKNASRRCNSGVPCHALLCMCSPPLMSSADIGFRAFPTSSAVCLHACHATHASVAASDCTPHQQTAHHISSKARLLLYATCCDCHMNTIPTVPTHLPGFPACTGPAKWRTQCHRMLLVSSKATSWCWCPLTLHCSYDPTWHTSNQVGP